MPNNTDQLAARTRSYRRLHKWIAVPLMAFLFLIGVSGVLLGWKKQTSLSPSTQTGAGTDAKQWIPIDSLQRIALLYIADSLQLDAQIDRMDIRPDKGIAKIVFAHHYTELQIDCTTGRVLSVSKRWNDFMEHLHDGTIVDRLIGTEGEPFKTSYTTLTSIGLMALSFSGFWIWLNPKRIRHIKAKK